MSEKLLQKLDTALCEHQPKLYAALQPGISIPRYRHANLKMWFAWRNGQPRDSREVLHGRYFFATFEDGLAGLKHMRGAVWEGPLAFLFMVAFTRRSFYSLPLVVDAAGDGYYYHLYRRTVYWKFKGEADILLPSFDLFLKLLAQFASAPARRDAGGTKEWELLQKYGTVR